MCRHKFDLDDFFSSSHYLHFTAPQTYSAPSLDRELPETEKMEDDNNKRLKNEEEKESSSSSEEEDEDEDEEEDMSAKQGGTSEGGTNETSDHLKRKREKRLAMNRASARARRKKKKFMLEYLGNQVTDLTKQNQEAQAANVALNARLEQLKIALTNAQATISALAATQQKKSQVGGIILGGAAAPAVTPIPPPATSPTTAAGMNQDIIRSLLLTLLPSTLKPEGLSLASALPKHPQLRGLAPLGGGAAPPTPAPPTPVDSRFASVGNSTDQDKLVRSLLEAALPALNPAHQNRAAAAAAPSSTVDSTSSSLLAARLFGQAPSGTTHQLSSLFQQQQHHHQQQSALLRGHQQVMGIDGLESILNNNSMTIQNFLGGIEKRTTLNSSSFLGENSDSRLPRSSLESGPLFAALRRDSSSDDTPSDSNKRPGSPSLWDKINKRAKQDK